MRKVSHITFDGLALFQGGSTLSQALTDSQFVLGLVPTDGVGDEVRTDSVRVHACRRGNDSSTSELGSSSSLSLSLLPSSPLACVFHSTCADMIAALGLAPAFVQLLLEMNVAQCRQLQAGFSHFGKVVLCVQLSRNDEGTMAPLGLIPETRHSYCT